jgi:hypothetical protein
MATYLENKKNIYKWRETHREAYNEYMKELTLARYHNKRDLINDRRKELYILRKDPCFVEFEIFRRMLL